jgi:hypothetical protein
MTCVCRHSTLAFSLRWASPNQMHHTTSLLGSRLVTPCTPCCICPGCSVASCDGETGSCQRAVLRLIQHSPKLNNNYYFCTMELRVAVCTNHLSVSVWGPQRCCPQSPATGRLQSGRTQSLKAVLECIPKASDDDLHKDFEVGVLKGNLPVVAH